MRRLALIFALITLVSTTIRIVTPERIVSSTVRRAKAAARIWMFLAKRLHPLLPQAN